MYVAQQWIMKLHNDGKGYSTITSVRGVVKLAFQMAYNEDIIRRNPFDFKLVDVVLNNSPKRNAMIEEQQGLWMGFIREDEIYAKYYDEFVVLLGTGMRVSEFCGLTLRDIDLENKVINIDHQLQRTSDMRLVIESTKTKCRNKETANASGRSSRTGKSRNARGWWTDMLDFFSRIRTATWKWRCIGNTDSTTWLKGTMTFAGGRCRISLPTSAVLRQGIF